MKSTAILTWLAGHDTGYSSKAIAVCALGGDPADGAARHPHDGGDFGRCYRLLQAAPEAREGLERLGGSACPYWSALFARWPEITAAYEKDLKNKSNDTSKLIRSILEPIEQSDRRFVRLSSGVSMRFGS